MSDKKLIVSPEYPKGILVDLTAEEIAQREQDAIKFQEEKQAKEATAAAKAEAEQSAINKLKALGLTDAEVKAFRG